MILNSMKVKPKNRVTLASYDCKSYANSRLENCIVRLSEQKMPARFMSYSSQDSVIVKIGDFDGNEASEIVHPENIEISHLPTGNSLIKEELIFFAKLPNRAGWKQGLYEKNLSRFYYDAKSRYFKQSMPAKIRTSDFIMPFREHYPTIDQALSLLADGFEAVPVDRNFSLVKSNGNGSCAVFFRVHNVGSFHVETKKLGVKPKFSFLKEFELPNSPFGPYQTKKGTSNE